MFISEWSRWWCNLHACYSSYWCLNPRCKSAKCYKLLEIVITCWFVFFIAFCVFIFWASCQHVLGAYSCHLYSGAIHAFLCALWWLAQACKLGYLLLISVVVISAKSESATLCCHVNLMLQVNSCIIWRCSLRMFCRYGYALSIHALVWNYGVL